MKHENEMKMAHKQKCPTIEEMATPKVRVPGCLDGAKAFPTVYEAEKMKQFLPPDLQVKELK